MGAPGTDRRSLLHAHQSARVATAGEDAALGDTTGLRSRRTYLVVGLGLVGLGLYIGIGEVANYFRIDGYLWMTAWVLAAILMCTLCFEVAGALTLSAAVHYDRPPAASRAFLAAAMLIRQADAPRGRSPPGDAQPDTSPSPRTRGRMLDHEAIDATAHRRLRVAARAGSAVALLGAAAVAATGGIAPRNPQFAVYQTGILLALMVVFTVAALVALRWEATGGAVMLVAATFVGVLAATEYTPVVAFAVFAVLAVPAVLHLLGWQRTRSLRHVLVVAAVVAAATIAGGSTALALHSYGFGPTHPISAAADPPPDVVEWVVAGATTSTATTVKARLVEETDEAWLLVSATEDLTGATPVGPVSARSSTDRVATFVVDGLDPGRTYHYVVEADGRVEQRRRGQVTTFPAGPASFAFAFASCAQTGSNGAVFDAIRAADPLFYIATGDMYYGDVGTDNPEAFAQLFTATLTSPAQSALYRSTSLAYTWDDHDYDGNDADRSAASRPAALAAYRTYVPHYPFVLPGAEAPVAQAFSVGRVRVVLTDLRSARSPAAEPDGLGKSMLGVRQRDWLLRELIESSRTHAVVVWVSATPWIVPSSDGDDTWGGYASERRLLSDAIEQAGVDNLIMLSGDAHMVAIDDGSHNTFASSGAPLFPVFHAAPLDRPAGTKGGPYSEGVSAQPGQFGLVQVEDDGAELVLSLVGRSWDGDDLPVSWTWRVPRG
jgi:phosphodiesterase/alkaline phosphatase D-like protein